MTPLLSFALALVLAPSNVLVLLLIVGAAVWRWRARSGAALVGLAISGLVVIGVAPGGLVLRSVLEDRFPPTPPPARVDGILVLGGYLETALIGTRGRAGTSAEIDRLMAAAELARLYPQARIVLTGGEKYGLQDPGQPPEAVAAAALLTEMGIAADRILVEPRSVNTWENAVFSKALVTPRNGETWLLVTSAIHTPRAVGAFRAAGWPGLVPWPVDFRTKGGVATLSQRHSVATSLAAADSAAWEFAGLTTYWLAGRSSALFPAP